MIEIGKDMSDEKERGITIKSEEDPDVVDTLNEDNWLYEEHFSETINLLDKTERITLTGTTSERKNTLKEELSNFKFKDILRR